MTDMNKTLSRLSTPDLLNLIDRLHEIGIQDEIPLPQIIVIGSQSSGKSSVLEAISRLSFPRGQGLTTTFATEIALRKASEVSIKARIIPSKRQKRSKEQETTLTSWSKNLTELKADDVGALVNDARELINKASSGGPMSFSYDKLRIEASGPDFPMLTLVDLPGLILNPNENQTLKDVQDAEDIVQLYMKNEKSWMLAIITAETELVNQKSLTLAQQADPKGLRTIGVITKPDLLPNGHPRIAELIKCARGEVEQRRLAHGWFVLKNRNFDAIDLSPEARDTEEISFLSKGAWADLGQEHSGVDRLRATLSQLQEETVRAALPKIMEQIDSRLIQCQDEHEKMGPARASADDQRHYLDKISMKFAMTVQQAVFGNYMDDRFFTSSDLNNPRELRAVLHKLYKAFVEDMNLNGRTTVLVPTPDEIAAAKELYATDQKILSTDQMLENIRTLHEDHKAFSLDGMFDPFPLVARLIKQETQKWETIARRHVMNIYQAIIAHLCLVIDHHSTSKDTVARIKAELIRKPMSEKQRVVLEKVKELVAPHQTWKPLTYNKEYWRQVYVKDSWPMQRIDPNADFFAKQAMEQCALTLNHLNTLYETFLITFIDNVVLLGVEMILIKDLQDTFTPLTVKALDPRRLAFIAAEPIEEQHHRTRVTARLEKLEKAKKVCDDYQLRISGASVDLPSTPGLLQPKDEWLETPLSTAPRTPTSVPIEDRSVSATAGENGYRMAVPMRLFKQSDDFGGLVAA